MNEDIVERLRRMAGLGLVNSGLMDDAAKEIERLRASVKAWELIAKAPADWKELPERTPMTDAEAIAYADMMVALVQIRSGSPPTHDEIARLIDRAQRARSDVDPEICIAGTVGTFEQ